MMKNLLDMTEELEVINKNPVKSGDVPRQAKAERRYLKVWEIDAILDAAPTAAKLLLRVLLMTGLRPGESRGLRVHDVDVARGRLAIRRDVDDLGHIGDVKTCKHRDVPIGRLVLDLLAAAADGRDDDAWLVPDEHGKVLTTARWRKVWRSILIHTGKGDLDTYQLRHTSASLAIAAGADVKGPSSSCLVTPPRPLRSMSTAPSGKEAWIVCPARWTRSWRRNESAWRRRLEHGRYRRRRVGGHGSR